jgi:alkanesulfonate monooxygenase
MMEMFPDSISVFSTCPASSADGQATYPHRVVETAQWSERAGCTGILVYADNSLIDPWLIAQLVLQNTRVLCPLVAVQPVYMHPYTVAKMVTSLAYLYGRRVCLNMVAGGFRNDLTALDDPTPHDRRYDRLQEYTFIIKRLLSDPAPLNHEGEFYRVSRLKLTPPLSRDLLPEIFLSGSSEAGLRAARSLGATAVQYPKPSAQCEPAPEGVAAGIRVGVIARPTETEAWTIARERFPEDRHGQLLHQLAMRVSDSSWHHQLASLKVEEDNHPYWLVPFRNYKTFCPYLVGSYQRVAAELRKYLAVGYTTFILDVPCSLDDLRHTAIAFHGAVDSQPGPHV